MSPPGRRLAVTLAIALLHGLIATAIASRRASYGPVGAARMFEDVHIYFSYASKLMTGKVPYRDYLVEYPLLSLLVFVPPRLAATTFEGYRIAFGLEMLLADAVAVHLVARQVELRDGWGRVAGRLAWYTLAFAVFCPLLLCRFDLVAMVLTFASATAWFSGRPRLGGALAAVGALVKIVPGVIVAPALVREIARRKVEHARGLAWFAGALTIGIALWYAIGGIRAEDSIRYHLERGVEVGSIYSGALMIAARATGAPIDTVPRHGCLEVDAPGSSAVGRLAFPLQVAALLLVMARFRRSPDGDPARYSGAAVLGFVLFNKVLSPQYLIWPLPFMAVLSGRLGFRVRAFFLISCVLTTLVYPFGFLGLLAFRGWAVGLLNLRNVMLAVAWGALLTAPDDRPEGSRPEPEGDRT